MGSDEAWGTNSAATTLKVSGLAVPVLEHPDLRHRQGSQAVSRWLFGGEPAELGRILLTIELVCAKLGYRGDLATMVEQELSFDLNLSSKPLGVKDFHPLRQVF